MGINKELCNKFLPFGTAIRNARLKRDWDMLELADALNVSYSSVARWERSYYPTSQIRPINSICLKKIGAVLGQDIVTLYKKLWYEYQHPESVVEELKQPELFEEPTEQESADPVMDKFIARFERLKKLDGFPMSGSVVAELLAVTAEEMKVQK